MNRLELSYRRTALPTPGRRTHTSFRLTPWSDDPVSDSGGEAFYVRDEESGQFWSSMPLPVRGETPYVTRHGFGYSVFEHTESGIQTETTVYVDVSASVKFTAIKVRNVSGRARRLSVTGLCRMDAGRPAIEIDDAHFHRHRPANRRGAGP